MTRDDITRMAREAGLRSAVILHLYGGKEGALCDSEIEELAQIELFAALVADAEAKRMHDEGFVTVGHMRQQIAAEREAILQMSAATWFKTQADYDAAIRARGQS